MIPRGWWRACVFMLAGCYSPTLPLPPPAEPDEQTISPTQVQLTGGRGSALVGATILIYNYANAQPVVATVVQSDGSWQAIVAAVKGNVLHIEQLEGEELSPSIDVTIM